MPATTSVTLHVTVPKGTRAGTYPVTVTASSAVGDVTRTLPVTVVDATCSAAGSSCRSTIGAALNLDGVATAATKTQGSFDGQGWSFPADQLPAPGVQVLGTQAFRIPDTGGTAPNFVAPAGTAVTVPVAGRFLEPVDAGQRPQTVTPPGCRSSCTTRTATSRRRSR